jgi:hypothetical protein
MLRLSNGEEIDTDLIKVALSDATGGSDYYFHLETGRVIFAASVYDMEVDEATLDEQYVPIGEHSKVGADRKGAEWAMKPAPHV